MTTFRTAVQRHDHLCRVEMTKLLEEYALRWVFNGHEHRNGYDSETMKEMRELAVENAYARNEPDLRVWSRHLLVVKFLLDVKHSEKYDDRVSITREALTFYSMQQTMQGLHMVIAGHTEKLGFRFFDLAYVARNKLPREFRDPYTGAPYEVVPITRKGSYSVDEFLGSMDPVGLLNAT